MEETIVVEVMIMKIMYMYIHMTTNMTMQMVKDRTIIMKIDSQELIAMTTNTHINMDMLTQMTMNILMHKN
jgi:hypothetical protein